MPGQKAGPYEACLTGKETPPYPHGISGPGPGLGYHAWQGYPENTFPTREEAEKVARLMNIAFREGVRERSRQIRDLIG